MLTLFERMGFAPRRCTWEITLACNLRCGHCGSRAGRARPDELTTEEAFTVIDDLATLGCRHVTLAGGEPTLRADWSLLIERLVSKGIRASLISNGMTWDEAVAKRAKEAGVHRLGFSLDGLERTHNCVRKANQGFDRVLNAVKVTREQGIQVVVVTHITKQNLGEVERLHALLGEHGVTVWQVQLGVPAGNLSDDRDLILGKDDLLSLLPRLAALKASGRAPDIFPADNIGYFGEPETILRGGYEVPFFVGCRAGLDVLGLESHGAVKGCLSMPGSLTEGNVRERSLVDIWRDPKSFAYNRQFKPSQLKGDCAGCEYGEICRGGCTWTSVSHFGHPHQFPHCFYRLSQPKPASDPVA